MGYYLKEEFYRMKTLNKTLSLILALAMVFGLMGVASAAFTDQSKITHTTAVDTCVALNIINGRTDGSYDPTGIVTRAELCKMICVAYNGGVTPTLATTTTPTYTDTASNWASAYIEYCTKLGIVAGNGDGTFSPDATVTGTQAAKMMLIALGYNAKNEGFTGTNWDTSVNVRANEKKLYDQLVSFDPATGLTRDNAAQMIYNMLQATEVEYTYSITTDASGKVTTVASVGDKYLDKSTNTKLKFVTDKYDLDNADGIVKDVEYDKTTKLYTITLVDAANTESTYTSTTDYENFYRQNVRILYKTDTDVDKANVYGLVALKSSVVLSGVLGQLSDSNLQTVLAADSGNTADSFKYNGTTYKFDNTLATTPVYANLTTAQAGYLKSMFAASAANYTAWYKDQIGATSNNTVLSDGYALGYTYKMVDNDGDGKIDLVVVYPVKAAKVTAVTSTTVKAGDTSYTIADENVYSGAAKGDYAKITAGTYTVDGKAKLEKITTMEGKVTGNTTGKATIGGLTLGVFQYLTVGTTYSDVAQVNGFIWYATEGTSTASAEYLALVEGTAAASGLNKAQAKLLKSDGTEVTVNTAVDYSSNIVNGAQTNAAYIADGTLVTYSVASSKYTLTAVSDSNKSSYKFYAEPLASAYSYTDGTIGAYAISDSAVVFAKTGTDTYKVITGAALKSVHALSGVITSNTKLQVLGTTNNTTGYSTAMVVYANTTGQVTGAIKYGFVTGAVETVQNSSNEYVSKVTFWDGSKSTTMTADANYTDYTNVVTVPLCKGTIFAYTVDSDGNLSIVDSITGTTKTDFLRLYLPQAITTEVQGQTVTVAAAGWYSASTFATKIGKTANFTTGVVSAWDGTKNIVLDSTSAIVNSDTVVYEINSDDNTASIATSADLAKDQGVYYVTSTSDSKTYVDFIVIDDALADA